MICRCGVATARPLCHYESRTVRLIRNRLCVSCALPVLDQDTERLEGRCAECRSANVALSESTRYLLHLAAQRRYGARSRAVTYGLSVNPIGPRGREARTERRVSPAA